MLNKFSRRTGALLLLVLTAGVMSGCGRDGPPAPVSLVNTAANETSSEGGAFTYEEYDAVLKSYVDEEGRVDYPSLQANRAELDRFIGSMATLSRATFEAWPEAERLAFWINAYNAITLERIIDRYPIKKGGLIAGLRYPDNSIGQIPGVWKKLSNTVLGKKITLDAIEHEILRVKFNEPRIHAAIVCAARSCPPLRYEAFRAERLETQLSDQSRKFLAKETRFRIDRAKKRVYLSAILDWFGADFVGVYNTDGQVTDHGRTKGATLEYVSRYVSEEDAQYLLSSDYSVLYLHYDWSLNEQ